MSANAWIAGIAGLALRPRTALWRWSFAAAALLAAVGLRVMLDEVLPPGFPFLTFFPAVILTAFLAGPGPAGAVGILSGLVAWYGFIPPFWQAKIHANSAVAMGFYAVIVATDIVIIHVMLRSLRHLGQERRRSADLAESRRLMFNELQHRVSNNLAMVSGLLSIQRRSVADATARKALEDAAQRVGLVARIQRLLHDPSAQALNLGDLLRELSRDMIEAAGLTGRVRAQVAADEVTLGPDQAVPVALIAAELLANSLEHGAVAGQGAQVTVDLRRAGPLARLTITDTGPGLPAGFDLQAATSLGLTIARQFAQQLQGNLQMDSPPGGGARSRLEFPLPD